MSVFVLGATGFLGVNTVEALLGTGTELRCGRRRRSNVLALRQLGAPLVEADLDHPAQLAASLSGTRTLVHLAGHYPKLSNDPAASLALAERQTRALLRAAQAAGVERLIYVSSTATVAPHPDRPSTEGDLFAAAPTFGTYHAVKWHMEQLVQAEAALEVSVVCPAACLGPWDLRGGTSVLLWAMIRGQAPLHPDGVVSWVDARDVGAAIARLCAMPALPERVLLSAQSEPLHALLERIAPRYGLSRLPPPLGREEAVALAEAEEARVAAEGGRPALSREIVDLVLHGAELDAGWSRYHLRLSYRALDDTLDAFDAFARRLGARVPLSLEAGA